MATNEFGHTQSEGRVNNGRRTLSKEEEIQIEQILDLEREFISVCRAIGTSRDLSLAITHIEDAALRAVRHVQSQGPKAPGI